MGMSTDDLVQLQQVTALYVHVIDAKQWDRLRDIYVDDAVFDLTGIAILMWGATKFFPAAEAWIMLLFLANVLLFLQNALLGDKVISYVRGPVVGAVAFPQVLPAALVVCTVTVGFLLVARGRRSWTALVRPGMPSPRI